MELRYIRDTDKREVDFVVIKNKNHSFAVECKLSDKNLSNHINYFSTRTPIPKFYQVHLDTIERQISDKISIIPFDEFCRIEKNSLRFLIKIQISINLIHLSQVSFSSKRNTACFFH